MLHLCTSFARNADRPSNDVHGDLYHDAARRLWRRQGLERVPSKSRYLIFHAHQVQRTRKSPQVAALHERDSNLVRTPPARTGIQLKVQDRRFQEHRRAQLRDANASTNDDK